MSWLTAPDEWDEDDAPRRSRWKVAALIVGAWLMVSLIVLAGLLVYSRDSSGHRRAAATADAQRSTPPSTVTTRTPTPTRHPSTVAAAPALVVPAGWVGKLADRQSDCAAHSYGRVRDFFTRTRCVGVQRWVATTSAAGRPVVVAASAVTLASAAQAASYLSLVSADGTGNVADLLREGASFPGGPTRMPPAGFAARQDGSRVLVAEAGYSSGASDAEDPALRALARHAVGG